jgi:acetyl esterase/lipase
LPSSTGQHGRVSIPWEFTFTDKSIRRSRILRFGPAESSENPADRPNLVAPIYGAPFGALPNIPSGTPPAFIAVAEDDPIAAVPVLKFFDALRAAKLTPELHVFHSGQHGFSMSQRNGTSDHWIEELYWWMKSYGLTHP